MEQAGFHTWCHLPAHSFVGLWWCGAMEQQDSAAGQPRSLRLLQLSEVRRWRRRERDKCQSPTPEKESPSLSKVHTRWIEVGYVNKKQSLLPSSPNPPSRTTGTAEQKKEASGKVVVPILSPFSRQVGYRAWWRCPPGAAITRPVEHLDAREKLVSTVHTGTSDIRVCSLLKGN